MRGFIRLGLINSSSTTIRPSAAPVTWVTTGFLLLPCVWRVLVPSELVTVVTGGGACVQKELLCQQAGLCSSSVSHDAFLAAIFERLSQDNFCMDALRW